ncbi:hypothetical protein MIMGU_mgv1a007961mg [Erythranthe guttata]|uniref:FAS1 domain-containing protein n=1 Tax=Erythranthe guttata TaxID=4155 RepID=A0A022RBG5_ERYGU|nr:hypothetical protein MIMGU_mgv1a007961mg [Erythranthe guttata]
MAAIFSVSHFTPLPFLYLLILLSSYPFPISSFNITSLLSSYPDLSDFNNLFTTTAVAADLTTRTSLTLLVVPNAYLRSASTSASSHPSPTNLADVLRYHVLLEYITLSDLRLIPPTGKIVTTLFQTTGRAAANSGTINITVDSSGAVTFHSPTSNATLLSPVKTLPYNISILSLNSLLIPYNVDLTASETRPPLGLNITKALIDGHDFNVAASMLAASGVVSEFEADEGGAGITLFVPTDEAFSDLPSSVKFQSLPADKKAMLNGAGSFTLNISRVNGSVGINTGVLQASVTQTVFDQNPVAIFGVSKVLLPREFFGSNPIDLNEPSGGGGGGAMGTAQPPETALSPEYPPIYSPPNHPGMGNRAAETVGVMRILLILWCTWICCHLFL